MIAVVIAVAVALALSWRGMTRTAPPGFSMPLPDACWLAAGEDCVLVCGRSGRLVRLPPDLSEEDAQWSGHFTHPSGFLGRPALLEGLVLVGCGDVRLRGVDLATGLKTWQVEVGGAVPGVTARGRLAYFGSDDGRMNAATEAGRLVWRTDLGARTASAPLVTEETVVTGTLAGEIVCVSRAQGEELWRVATDAGDPVYARPVMGPSTILVGDDGGVVHNITREGERLSGYEFEGLVRAAVAVRDSVVVAGDSAGVLVRLDPSDMSEVWRVELGGPIATEPVIVGDDVWCGAGRELVRLKAESGRIAGRRLAEAETCDLLAAHGRVYWATTDGRVRAVPLER